MNKQQQELWLAENKDALSRPEYDPEIRALADSLDTDVILKKKGFTLALKSYILKSLGRDRHVLTGLFKKINIQILRLQDGKLHIEGICYEKFIDDSFKVIIINEQGETGTMQYSRAPVYDQGGSLGSDPIPAYCFHADLPLYAGAKYHFALKTDSEKLRPLGIYYGKFSRLTDLSNSFFCDDGYIVKAIDNKICIYNDSFKTRLATSRRFNNELPGDVVKLRKAAIKARKSHKPIWILSDRTDQARDNGEALLDYLLQCDAKDKYDIYFVIEKDSDDYERMRRKCNVLIHGSFEYKVMHLASSMIISSSGDDWIRNPFGADAQYYKDLMTAKYVFLQHGVIIHDLSNWLTRLKKDITLFCCSSDRELDSIVNDSYGYGNDVVKVTGLARFDKLHDDNKKVVAIVPTWRKEIASELIPGTSDREYNDEFKNSSYFEFYNNLINDERLLSVMKEYGYKGVFYPHPNIRKQACDFSGNELFHIWDELVPYSRVFNESSLLVTDYSSIATDFAYLRKPIIYSQFDHDYFFSAHTLSDGYFDYKKDGFGPVCYNYEDTISSIIDCVKRDCTPEENYKERIDDFFAYSDNHNCERIYKELLEIQSALSEK